MRGGEEKLPASSPPRLLALLLATAASSGHRENVDFRLRADIVDAVEIAAIRVHVAVVTLFGTTGNTDLVFADVRPRAIEVVAAGGTPVDTAIEQTAFALAESVRALLTGWAV
jgi:hypothetical protein